MAQKTFTGGGGVTPPTSTFPDNPNEPLGFEIATKEPWSFVPEFYPSDFTQMKKKELTRFGGGCSGESVSIKAIKNREFHAEGRVLQSEIPTFQSLLDYEKRVDLISPLTPNGGMEAFVKRGELMNQVGYDPHTRERLFKYSLDLVSTGRDETDSGQNAIVTAVMKKSDEFRGV